MFFKCFRFSSFTNHCAQNFQNRCLRAFNLMRFLWPFPDSWFLHYAVLPSSGHLQEQHNNIIISMESNDSKQGMQSQSATLCKAGCGFYGSSSSDGYCSVCFKQKLQRRLLLSEGVSATAPSSCDPPSSDDSADQGEENESETVLRIQRAGGYTFVRWSRKFSNRLLMISYPFHLRVHRWRCTCQLCGPARRGYLGHPLAQLRGSPEARCQSYCHWRDISGGFLTRASSVWLHFTWQCFSIS